jgi:rhamnogalacturonyl hydrolase YesR
VGILQSHRIVSTREKRVRGLKNPVNEKDKEDVIQIGQNVHTTQTFSKKEILKRPFSSPEDSITKLLTKRLSGSRYEGLIEYQC